MRVWTRAYKKNLFKMPGVLHMQINGPFARLKINGYVREKYCWLAENKRLKAQANRLVFVLCQSAFLLFIRRHGSGKAGIGVRVDR
jgi:hypothetical protein